MKRFVFIISDGTGITAESLANSLLTQFDNIRFDKQIIPYVDNIQKATELANRINQYAEDYGQKPLVFMTFVNPEMNDCIKSTNACVFDLFSTFLAPLEQELQTKSSYTVGRSHSVSNAKTYNHRMEAVDFTLNHDDGIKIRDYEQADIVLIGV